MNTQCTGGSISRRRFLTTAWQGIAHSSLVMTCLLLSSPAKSSLTSGPPTNVSLTPNNVTSPVGAARVFAAVYSDPSGATNLDEVSFRVGNANPNALYRFVAYLESLPDQEALRMAGVLSENFWLRSVL